MKKNRAFTLVEMVVYVGITAIVITALVQTIAIAMRSNRTSFSESNIRNSAHTAFETLAREIRASENIASESVLYPSENGILQLYQENEDGILSTIRFATTSTGALEWYKGVGTTTLVGPLSLRGVRVNKLIFAPITASSSRAVRVSMQLSVGSGTQTKSEWFYGTFILRGSY